MKNVEGVIDKKTIEKFDEPTSKQLCKKVDISVNSLVNQSLWDEIHFTINDRIISPIFTNLENEFLKEKELESPIKFEEVIII